MIRRNIIANAVGGTTTLLLNLLVTPFLITILGAEAYGLLGLIASLQILFAVLDLGLSTTIVKEIASDTSPDRADTHGLVGTLAVVYWGIALTLGGALFLSADWIVSNPTSRPNINANSAASIQSGRAVPGGVTFCASTLTRPSRNTCEEVAP